METVAQMQARITLYSTVKLMRLHQIITNDIESKDVIEATTDELANLCTQSILIAKELIKRGKLNYVSNCEKKL